MNFKFTVKKLIVNAGKIGLFLYIPYCSHYPAIMTKINFTRTNCRWGYSLAKNIFLCKFFWWDRRRRKTYLFILNLSLQRSDIDKFDKISVIDHLAVTEGVAFVQNLISFKQIPSTCIDCKNLHGEVYGENLLVCAIHPSGKENCPDRR